MSKMKFVLTGITLSLTLTSFSSLALTDEQLIRMNLHQLRQVLDKKEATSEQLVSAYLSQINKNNHQGKKINAVIFVNEEAMAQAKEWDALPKDAKTAKPLSGIPFLVKDNFNTKGIPTTGGSLALADNRPATNAFVVQKLLDDGAILLGKTNMSELAASYGWFGYSSTGGQTINPYNPLRDASGSSSGSAAAVAADFAPFALGTDTSGSIRGPASVTGNVGMRPTLGLTSRSGVIPLSLTADDAGVITRDVEDQAIVLDVIKGADKNDAASMQVDDTGTHFSDVLTDFTLKGKRIAVVDNFDGGNADVDRVKREATARLQEKGAIIAHIRLPAQYENLWSLVLGPVGTAEFRPQMDVYLSSQNNTKLANSEDFLKSLSRLTDEGKKFINPARYKGLIESINTKSTDSPEYIHILTMTIPGLRQELISELKKGKYDAFMFPTMSCPASVIPGHTDPQYSCKSADPYAASYIASSTGFPEISVPAGKAIGNIPVGISFLSKAGDDLKLLQLGYAFENGK